jgi:hypothetical protein
VLLLIVLIIRKFAVFGTSRTHPWLLDRDWKVKACTKLSKRRKSTAHAGAARLAAVPGSDSPSPTEATEASIRVDLT